MAVPPRERDPQSAAEWLQNKLAGSDGWNAASIASLLSEATVELLGRMDDPLSFTLYFDEGDPRIRNTRLLLDEFARAGAQVSVDVRRLADHPNEEDRYGIGSSNSVVVQAAERWALVQRPTEGALYEGLAHLVNARDTVIYVAVGAGEGDLLMVAHPGLIQGGYLSAHVRVQGHSKKKGTIGVPQVLLDSAGFSGVKRLKAELLM